MVSLSFNRIHVTGGPHAGADLTPEQFLELSVTDRVHLVLSKQVVFFQHQVEKDKRLCLNELRQWTSEH